MKTLKPCTCGCTDVHTVVIPVVFGYGENADIDFIDKDVCVSCGKDIIVTFDDIDTDDLPF